MNSKILVWVESNNTSGHQFSLVLLDFQGSNKIPQSQGGTMPSGQKQGGHSESGDSLCMKTQAAKGHWSVVLDNGVGQY